MIKPTELIKTQRIKIEIYYVSDVTQADNLHQNVSTSLTNIRIKRVNTIHTTLFASALNDRQYCLIGEIFGRGVMDSGCTKTVSGDL